MPLNEQFHAANVIYRYAYSATRCARLSSAETNPHHNCKFCATATGNGEVRRTCKPRCRNTACNVTFT